MLGRPPSGSKHSLRPLNRGRSTLGPKLRSLMMVAQLGTAEQTSGDPQFGHIRVAAVPLPEDTIAMSVPYDARAAGSWAGDVLFNGNYDFANIDEFFSVAVHEVGDMLGLPHSDNPQSPMHVHGVSSSVLPLPEDVAQLRIAFGVAANEEIPAGSLDGEEEHEEREEHEEHEEREEHEKREEHEEA